MYTLNFNKFYNYINQIIGNVFSLETFFREKHALEYLVVAVIVKT